MDAVPDGVNDLHVDQRRYLIVVLDAGHDALVRYRQAELGEVTEVLAARRPADRVGDPDRYAVERQ